MSKLVIAARMLIVGLCTLAATNSYSAILSPTRDALTPLLSTNTMSEQLILVRARGHANRNVNVNVHHNVHVHGHVHHHVGGVRGVVVIRPVRPWIARPYYGAVVASVALGTVIAATTVAAVPVAPAPTLCWYWADAAQIRGYWDYCKLPH